MWLKKVDYKEADWEEILDEDLWEDGELGFKEVERKIIEHLQITGDWKIIRRKHEKQNKPKNSNA